MACRLAGAKPLSEPNAGMFFNWSPRYKFQWNLNRKPYIFIQENAFENVVRKMVTILSRPKCVNGSTSGMLQVPYWSPQELLQSHHNSVLSWWRHQMETFSALLAICAGNSPVSVNSPHKGQWRGALMLSLICARKNGWVKNCETPSCPLWRHLWRHCNDPKLLSYLEPYILATT